MVKRAPKDIFWPPVATEQGRKDAILYGAVAAGWIAVSNLVGLVYLLATGEILLAGPVADEAEFIGWAAIHAVLVLVAAILCWRIWRRHGRFAAVFALVWLLVDLLFRFAAGPGSGIIIGIILVLAAVHGIRGTWAEARLRTAHAK
jgi:hypothetical protein